MKKIISKMMSGLLIASLMLSGIASDVSVVRADDNAGQEAEIAETEESAGEAEEPTDETNEPSGARSEPPNATEQSEEDALLENAEDLEEADVINDEETEGSEDVSVATDSEPFSEEKTVDGVTISVRADAGVIPDGASLSVSKVGNGEQNEVEKAVDEARDDGRNVAVSYTFDISLHDADGNEIEPDTSAGTVKVTFDSALIANGNLQADVYHLEEADGSDYSAEKLDAVDTDGSSVTVETDGFSYYTVEFTYGNLQYVLSGDAEVALAEILATVGLSGEVTVAKGSNDDLFSVEQRDGGWFVTAKKAFSSEERLEVTLSGVVYGIVVTDDADDTAEEAKDEAWLNRNYEYTTPNENDTTLTLTKYIGEDVDVIVPAHVVCGNKTYTTVLYQTFFRNETVQTIRFENGVILKSGHDLFVACVNLQEVDFTGIVCSNVTDMWEMFTSCKALTDLNLSNIDTSQVTTMYAMFANCSSLKTLDLSHFNTSNVQNMSWMFTGCTALTSLDLSNFDTSSVANTNSMFASCSALTSLNVSSFDTRNVTNMSGMFTFCKSLDSVDVSNFNTSNVTDMSGMFCGGDDAQRGFLNLDLSSFDTSSVTNMEGMFERTSLTDIDISNFNTSKVTNMSRMFYSSKNLKKLNLSTFDTSNVTDSSDMFNGCWNLTTIRVSDKWVNGSGKSSDMFKGCDRIVGENGTTYDASYVDNAYAHIDTDGNAGYFSSTTSHVLSGRVYDYKGSWLNGAKIEAVSKNGNISKKAESRRNGDYLIYLPDGEYTIKATMNNYGVSDDITVAGQDITKDLSLIDQDNDDSEYPVIVVTNETELNDALMNKRCIIRLGNSIKASSIATNRSRYNFLEDIILDLNGYTLSSDDNELVCSKNLKIMGKGGSSIDCRIRFYCEHAVIEGGNYLNISLESGSHGISELRMEGGTVQGGVTLYGANNTFIMTGGEIFDGVDVWGKGTFSMYGGEIHDSCTGNGVTITEGEFNCYGGKIYNNKGTGNFSGVNVPGYKQLNVSGNPQILSNGNEEKPKNVFLDVSDYVNDKGDSAQFINGYFPLVDPRIYDGDEWKPRGKSYINLVGKLTDGCKIGVYPTTLGDFTQNYKYYMGTDDPNKYFQCDREGYMICLNEETGEAMIKAENNVTIGIVSDENGNPLSGATVELLSDGKVIDKTTSGTDGKYTFTGLTDGNYTIRATYNGNTGTTAVTVSGRDITNADVTITIPDAKTTFSISGRIIEPNNNGYPGVKITAGGKTVNSDKNGNFTISGLKNGTYEIVATHGNGTGKATVTINGKDEEGVTITLVKKGSKTSVSTEKNVGKGKVVSQVTTEPDTPSVSLEAVDDGVLTAALTDKERADVENGKTVVIRLDAEKVDEDEVSTSDRNLVKSCAESTAQNAVVGMYLDLNLYKSVGGSADTPVTDLNGHALSVELDVPNELYGPRGVSRRFYIIRVHNGIVELLASTRDTHITFKTDKFSVYSLAYSDTAQSASTAGNADKQTATASSGSGRQAASSGGGSTSSSDTHQAGKGTTKAEYTVIGKDSVRYEYPAFGSKKNTAKVPDTVKIGKKTYKVTSIASYAFAGSDKLTEIEIGKYVKRIGKNAFDGCAKLKKITVDSKKLTKQGIKGALSGSSVKKVYAPEDKVKAYRKIFSKENAGSKGKVTVKAGKKK